MAHLRFATNMIINKDSLYIQELRNDSHTAFEALYDMYSDSLYGYVLLHTKSTFSAEEIVQDTFIKVWTNRRNLSTEGSFKALLFTIAKNQIIDAFRNQINKEEFLAFITYKEANQSEQNPVEADIYYEDFLEKLNSAKTALPQKQRLIFELNREKGMSIKAIANKLEISEQTVKNQLTSALKTLREKLKEYNYIFFLFL